MDRTRAMLDRFYPWLRAVASRAVRREWSSRPSPTSVANEVVERVLGQLGFADVPTAEVKKRLALNIRRVLIDRGRRRHNLKAGGGVSELAFDEGLDRAEPARQEQRVTVREALQQLEREAQPAAQAYTLFEIEGYTIHEVAGAMGVSPAAVDRYLRFARLWLRARYREETA